MKIFKDGDNPLYQPWSERDFRADFDAAMLDWLQRYMYRTLCQAAFVCDTRPYLPDDDSKLWVLAGCRDCDQWEENKGPVRAMFTPIKRGGQNLLSRKRIADDWQRLVAKRRAQRRGGQIGGRKASHAKPSETQIDETQANLELTPSQPQAVKRSKGKEREVKVSQVNLPTNPGKEGPDGRMESLPDSPSKPSACGSGQGKKEPLLGWRAEFQKKIQEKAADKGITLQVLPNHVYEFVESYDDLEAGQFAVLDWFEGRSFEGLRNPNEPWNKMRDEIHGHLVACGLEDEAGHVR